MEEEPTTHAMDLVPGFSRLQTKSDEEKVGCAVCARHAKMIEGEEKPFQSMAAACTGTIKTQGEENPFKSAVAKTQGEENPFESGEVAGGGDLSFTLDAKTMYLYAAIGNAADIIRNHGKTTLSVRTAPDGKRKRLVRFDKRYVEGRISMPIPVYRRTPYEFLDEMDAPARHARIAEDDRLAALNQKEIDREAEMRRQYAITGYADIELTDGEEEEPGEWRPWAYLKAVGLVD